MENAQREAIVAAVEARMRSFEAAERDRDAERAIAHFAAVPDFHVYNDGRLVTYEQVAAAVRGGFSRVRSIETPFDNLRVLVLSAEHALISATFRRTITDGAGAVRRSQGAATWLWRNIDGQWLIAYGQLDHRPDEGTSDSPH
jgi:ketosteroid isomerase-like protein